MFRTLFAPLGNYIMDGTLQMGRGSLMLIETFRQSAHCHKYARTIIKQVFSCGVAAVPVVAITSLFSGLIIAGQTGATLRSFGVQQHLGALVGATMVRELGPVLTCIVVAGFVGGGMSSTIATMRVNEEIDALEVMSINPIRFLVMPRLLAMLIAVPVLTAISNTIGMWGGMIVASMSLSVAPETYWQSAKSFLEINDVAFGVLKSLVFGVLITIISCEQGYYATGGAEGVGRATMRSVVYSFLAILISNYIMFSLIWQTFMSGKTSAV